MARPFASPEAAPSRLRRRTSSFRLRTLRSRPSLAHGAPRTALTAAQRQAAAKPPRWLVESGIGLVAAYVVYTAINFSTAGTPAWAGHAMLTVAGLWFAAVLASDVRRWKHYDALQRTKAVLVWAAVLVFALAV